MNDILRLVPSHCLPAFPLFAALLATLPFALQAQVPTPRPTPSFIIAGPISDWSPRGTNPVLMGTGSSRVWDTLDADFHYSIAYWNESGEPRNVNVHVEEVQDTRWMLHEIELHFRRKKETYESRTPEDKARVAPYGFETVQINGSWLFSSTGGLYVWTSDPNRVVTIGWARQIDNPDGTFRAIELPPEFLDTYLGLLPSTLPAITFDDAHEQQFIRDAFDRDFEHGAHWLAKWQESGAKPDQDEYADVLAAVGRILDRKSRYYSGPSFREWEHDLGRNVKTMEGLRQFGTYKFLRVQYDELKAWWDAHRNHPIDLSRGKADFDRDGLIGRQ
jgi:hypothetical protein